MFKATFDQVRGRFWRFAWNKSCRHLSELQLFFWEISLFDNEIWRIKVCKFLFQCKCIFSKFRTLHYMVSLSSSSSSHVNSRANSRYPTRRFRNSSTSKQAASRWLRDGVKNLNKTPLDQSVHFPTSWSPCASSSWHQNLSSSLNPSSIPRATASLHHQQSVWALLGASRPPPPPVAVARYTFCPPPCRAMRRRLSQRRIAALGVLGLGVACVDGDRPEITAPASMQWGTSG